MSRQNERVAREESLTTRLTLETYQPPAELKTATMPWWAAALGAGLVSAIGGWALVSALVLISQLAQTDVVVGPDLKLSTQMWLLGQGGILVISGVRITLVPLGFTAILAVLLYGTAGYAARQAVLAGAKNLGLAVAKVTGVVAVSYTVTVTIASFLVDGSDLRAASGGLGLSLVMAFFGARKSAKWNPAQSWPVWMRAIPRAIGAGVLTALLGGTVVLAAGLIAHRDQIILMTDGLNPGWTGGIVLAFLQLFYVVNIIVWCVSWSYGPGFTLGDGSVVSLMGSQVGMLPAFPITAALPSGDFTWAAVGWLAIPVCAGAAAAIVILRARPRARFDETALVGGLSGVLAGVGVAGLAAATRGSLGVSRLVGLGPFPVPLLIIACSIMGLGGMLTGFIAGLVRRPKKAADPLWWSRWGVEPAARTQEDTGATVLLAHTPTKDHRPFGWLTPVMKSGKKSADSAESASSVPAESASSVPADSAEAAGCADTVTEKISDSTAVGPGSESTTQIIRTTDEQPPLDFHPDD